MGSSPSSHYSTHPLSFLRNKKITTLKPIYLYYYKNKRSNGWDYENCQKGHLCFFKPEIESENPYKSCPYDFVMEINCNISFYINDIIGYCYNEGGVYTYEIEPCFFHKIKTSECKIIKASDEYIEKFNKIKKIDLNNKVFMDEITLGCIDFYFNDSLLKIGSKFNNSNDSDDDLDNDSINIHINDIERIKENYKKNKKFTDEEKLFLYSIKMNKKLKIEDITKK